MFQTSSSKQLNSRLNTINLLTLPTARAKPTELPLMSFSGNFKSKEKRHETKNYFRGNATNATSPR